MRLAARQLTAGDVVGALQEQNVNVAAGSVGDSPARAGQTYQMSVRAAGRLRESSEFEDIIVKAGADGSLVRLSDVGTAELGAETYSSVLRYQGIEALGFARDRAAHRQRARRQGRRHGGARAAVAVVPAGTGVPRRVRHDRRSSRNRSGRCLITLLEAVGLVVLVMFVFLQSWRATLIPALTLPVSLIGAFAFVNLLGFSINTLTLFAIVLATGIVVDDAIVVIENIERHIQEYKKPPLTAASDAMGEVFGAVIATALVLIAVFVPVAFFPGTTGRLYQQFALTIAFSVAISAFNALTLTPALSALLLRHEALGKGRFFGAIERVIHGGTDLYVRTVRGLVRVRWAIVVLFVGLLGLTYLVYTRVPQAFVPEEDAGYFITVVQAPAGASLEYTTNVASQAEKILMSVPEVESVFSVMGFSFAGSAPNQGLIFTLLKPFAEREEPEQRIQGLLPKIRGALFGIQDGAGHSRSRRRRSRGSATSAGSRSRSSIRAGAATSRSSARARRRWSAHRSSRRSSPGCSAASPPTTRSSPSTSTARRRAAWACRSARSRARCRSISGRPMSTTSTSTTARIASTCRRTRRSVPIRATSGSTTPARIAARWCRLPASCGFARRRRRR